MEYPPPVTSLSSRIDRVALLLAEILDKSSPSLFPSYLSFEKTVFLTIGGYYFNSYKNYENP